MFSGVVALANVGTGVLDGPRAKEMLERIWNVKNIVAPMFVQTYFTYTDRRGRRSLQDGGVSLNLPTTENRGV